MDSLLEFLNALNSLSPLAVIALLGTIIFILVRRKAASPEAVAEIKDNHLHDMPEMVATLRKIDETLQRMEVRIAEDLAYIRARINGTSK